MKHVAHESYEFEDDLNGGLDECAPNSEAVAENVPIATKRTAAAQDRRTASNAAANPFS